MKISVIQPDTIWSDKAANLERLTRLISKIPDGTDLVILPEMFNTGFSVNPKLNAEPLNSATHTWMKNIAVEYGSGICGSFVVEKGNSYFNTWVFVSPAGDTITYDKRHLFSPGGEDKLFKRGTERVIFSFRGVRICPGICYDLRFPVWSRNRNDYDLLIYSANWPEKRREIWTTLLMARAIENQCFVAGSNRTGTDGEGISYCGDSVVAGPVGDRIAAAGGREEAVVSCGLDIDWLHDFRSGFPVWKDADRFVIDP